MTQGADARLVKQLEHELSEKARVVQVLKAEVKRLTNKLISSREEEGDEKSLHPLEPVIHLVGDKKTKCQTFGRSVSKATASALEFMGQMKRRDSMALKMVNMFKSPDAHASYLTTSTFALDIIKVCQRVAPIFEAEPRAVFLQSPVYVFGDIHGNLEDLNFFADNMWKLGMNVTAGRFLFLGDYVDRGMQGLECLAYLFSLKMENPDKMFMLRGNHELRDVNGWVEHYGERSFLWQCQNRFGHMLGERVWEACNAVFDRLPLAGVIDHDIFCVHGGIPRPLSESASRIQDIMCVPSVASVCPPNDRETFESQQVASDCLWSDPANEAQEATLGETGFGESLRGGGAICFGNKAIDDFLTQGNLSYIVRAHEAHSEGVSLRKGAKVFTVFSTSKDHGQGKGATCGCILVDFHRLLLILREGRVRFGLFCALDFKGMPGIKASLTLAETSDASREKYCYLRRNQNTLGMNPVINRSAKYKNKYVHRRDSVSLANLTLQELQVQVDLGLVILSDSDEGSEVDEIDDEETVGYHASGGKSATSESKGSSTRK